MGRLSGEGGWVDGEAPDLRDRSHRPDQGGAAESSETRGGPSQALAWQEAIFEGSRDAILISNSRCEFVAVNQAAVDLTGYSREELLQKRITDLHDEEDHPRLQETGDRVRAGEDVMHEVAIRRKDGEVVLAEFSCRSLLIGGRKYCHAVARDTTERRRAEEALRLSEARYRSIFEQAVLGIYRTTPDGRILAANPSLLQMLRFDSLDELVARNLEKEGFEPGYPRSVFRRRLETAGEVVGLESAWTRRDGSILWVRENAKAIRNEAGETLFYEGTVEDITAKKEAQDALQASRERLDRVIEGTRDGIWEWPDMSQNKLWWSPRGFELLGYEPDAFEPTFDLFKGLLHPDDVDRTIKTIEATLDAGKPFESEHRLRTKSGAYRWFGLRGRCFGGQGDRPRSMAGSIRDITERQRLQEHLAGSERQLRLITDNIPALVALVDTEQRCRFVNRQFGRAFKVAPEEVVGRHLKEVLGESGYTAVADYVRAALAGEAVSFERELLLPGVGMRWLEVDYVSNVDSDGVVQGFCVLARDVTEPKQVKTALAESEQRLQATIRAAELGIWEWDMRTQGVRIGGQHERLLGFAPGEFDGRAESFYQRVHPEDLRGLNETTAKAIEDRVDCCTEFRIVWPDGSVHWLAGRGRFERDADDRPIRMLGAFQDITERKLAAEALQLSEERFRVFMEHLPAAAFIKDCQKKQLYANRSASEVMNLARSESGDKSERSELPLAVAEQFQKHDDVVLQEDRVVGPNDISWDRDGRRFWLRDVRFPITTPKGERLIGGFAWNITEAKQMEEALRESEERFRVLVENLADGVFAHDLEGRFVLVNRAACENTGYSRRELLSMTVADIDSGSLERDDLKKMWRSLKPGRPVKVEVVHRRKDGSFYPVEIHLNRLVLQGRATILGVARDITERRRAVEALVTSEQKYRKLFNLSPESIILMDADGVVLDVNPRFVEWMEGRREDFIGRLGFDLPTMPDDARGQLREAFHRRKESLAVDPYEVRFMTAAGTTQVGRILGTPVFDDANAFLYMLLMVQDVTERKRAEEALRESETRFRELFHNMASGVAVYEAVDGGRDFVFRDLNRACEEISRLRRADVMGKRLGEVLPGIGNAGLLAVHQGVWQSGDAQHAPEVLYEDASRSFWLETHVYRLPSGEIVAIYDDVTHRKEVERRIVSYQDKLKALTTELSLAEERERHRIGMGLHDHVGQSLVMTKFSLQRLGAKTDAVTKRTLDEVCDQIDGLIDEIRSLTFELSDSVLYEVGFKEAVSAYLNREVQRKHGIVCELDSEGEFSKLNDDMKIVLFRNLRELLTNVIKHARAKRVQVRLGLVENRVTVEVTDDGVGFKPELSGAASAGEQTHFGLFSVREQLGCFGGRLEIRSEPGRGTCITMTVLLPDKT